ncbi:AT-rich interactive domain-containing protein 4A-like isoform X2 [Coccinella septempunctata]|uniref:AT-rich interactive domain-containing protein 4A-like isoform X2 n=1 Tax=Coccinella septempunctata TaxID=41139 RepID=UPI001D06C9F4|nr:AT-rich interactive domain-containing protein 4A-like isoform X2 [Coccinella septempunctata]
MSDDPPILPVGTAVSAKYKGAFCEAKVSRVFPQLRYRVSFKEPHTGTETLKEEHIKATGPIRTGRTVLAWHPAQKTFLEAQVTKIQDQSQYTVVFDDGDITTLRRNYLCLKSGRHFNESETLDQLPLTHPEHFSNPVIGGRSRRRNRNREDDSEGEHEEADPEMEGYHSEVGRVVWGENLEKKRNKDWPPGLIMMPKNTKILNTKEEFLIRSFKDDRFYNVPKKDVIEFSKEVGEKLENNNTPFSIGVQKALKYLNTGELPANWEKHFHSDRMETDAELNFSDSSDDEPCEEKDRFVAQLFKFLDEAGTPLNKTPTIAGEDVDLYRLFSVVNKLGGYNKVNNHNKWKAVTGKLKYGNSQSITNQVKAVYKKCLLSFETFYKTLGVTMLTHSKSSRKNKGRSLIRDKDRATPINSPKTEKEEETPERKEEEKPPEDKKARPSEIKDDKKKKEIPDASESSSDNNDHMEPSTSRDQGRPKRYTKVKSWAKEKKTTKVSTTEKSKPLGEKPEEPSKKDDEKDKGQQTRSKTQLPKVITPTIEKKVESKTPTKEIKEKDNKDIKDKNLVKTLKKVEDEKDKTKRPRKRSNIETENVTDVPASFNISKGDKLKVYYGPSIESKVTYEAKVLDIVRDGPEPFIRVHYTGWNNRYDEWIKMERVAENLSATTKAKKIKQVVSGNSSPVASKSPSLTSNKQIKRKRGVSDSRRPSINETTRSTTPLSSTSNSSRPKTPATPATRSTTRSITQEQKRIRRTSVQTDTSVHTDTESPASESEAEELSRTRSGGKSDETELKVYKKKIIRTAILHRSPKIREEDDDTEKEEDQIVKERIVKRTRKIKRTPEKSNDDSDDESGSLPKGRDFDLNQIRSELKGFSKALPLNSIDSADKDSSSDDSAKPLDIDVHVTAEEEEEEKELKKTEEKDMKPLEETSSCEDIYEFKEPEPFEFESRSSLGEDKSKKRLNRFYEDLDKSPSKGTSKVPRLETNYETDKKTFRSPVKIIDFDEDGGIDSKPKKESGDLFDKLVESPSFNIVKTAEKQVEVIPKLEVEESIEIIAEQPEIADDCSGDMELSDTESQTQPIFTVQSEEVFSDAFTKSSSEQNTLDLEFCKSEDRNVDEEIQASIQRVIEQTSTDDDTQDALLQVTLPVTTYQVIKHEQAKSPLISPKVVNVIEETVSTEKNIEIVEKSAFSMIKQLTPVVHSIVKESSNTTEIVGNLVVSTSPIPIQLEDDIELKAAEISLSQNLEDSKDIEMIIVEDEVKDEIKIEKIDDDKIEVVDVHQEITESCSIEPDHLIVIENDQETIEIKVDTEESETADDSQNLIVVSPKEEVIPESKKRRKVISRPFIESDTDSTDSDNLIIARSDDESQSNSTLEKEMKDNWDSNMSTTEVPTNTTDDSQTEDQRNFKFEESVETENKQEKQNEEAETKSISEHVDIEDEQKQENDSQLHSMLLCEETIPRSPAPPTETNVEEPVRRSKSALEMPFASVPGSSNNKSMLLNPNPAKLHQQTTLMMQIETENEGNASPLSSAESTLSNLSPRGNNGGLSPYSQNNDNSNTRTEFQEKRTNSNKMSAYSDEDSQLVCESSSSQKKNIKDDRPSTSTGRKSRRSYQSNDQSVPAKKGRKSGNRSGHNSDSEENASVNSPKGKAKHNSGKWPERPVKYDFRVNLDGITDRTERINLVLNSMTSLRKTYADLKAELADLDRRRKKIKRRKREAFSSLRQAVSCT